MTFTVESKHAVSAGGDVPAGAEASYENTYNKGTVRKDDVATLTLTGLGGITIDKVDISMRSNKAAGAGTVTVKADGKALTTKSGSFKDWAGAFDKDNFHTIPIYSSSCTGVKTLEIQVTGSENSLWLNQFIIRYQQAPPRTVTLRNGTYTYAVMTEKQGGAGVVLPVLKDTAEWYFAGWSENHFYEIQTRPTILPATTLYQPVRDCTLWAVYSASTGTDDVIVTDPESGVYMYANLDEHFYYAMTGTPKDGIIGNGYIDTSNKEQYYSFSFNASLDIVYITHMLTGTPIGYSGTQMAAVSSPWSVYHNGEEFVLYTSVNDKKYVLWLNILDSSGEYYYAGLFPTDDVTNLPMRLLRPATIGETSYTCQPKFPLPVERPAAEASNETIIPFGNYELHINNGHKYLKIR